LNGISYFLGKSPGRNDCEQLDPNLRLEGKVLDEICSVECGNRRPIGPHQAAAGETAKPYGGSHK
jgi:hypothetical protein